MTQYFRQLTNFEQDLTDYNGLTGLILTNFNFMIFIE